MRDLPGYTWDESTQRYYRRRGERPAHEAAAQQQQQPLPPSAPPRPVPALNALLLRLETVGLARPAPRTALRAALLSASCARLWGTDADAADGGFGDAGSLPASPWQMAPTACGSWLLATYGPGGQVMAAHRVAGAAVGRLRLTAASCPALQLPPGDAIAALVPLPLPADGARGLRRRLRGRGGCGAGWLAAAAVSCGGGRTLADPSPSPPRLLLLRSLPGSGARFEEAVLVAPRGSESFAASPVVGFDARGACAAPPCPSVSLPDGGGGGGGGDEWGADVLIATAVGVERLRFLPVRATAAVGGGAAAARHPALPAAVLRCGVARTPSPALCVAAGVPPACSVDDGGGGGDRTVAPPPPWHFAAAGLRSGAVALFDFRAPRAAAATCGAADGAAVSGVVSLAAPPGDWPPRLLPLAARGGAALLAVDCRALGRGPAVRYDEAPGACGAGAGAGGVGGCPLPSPPRLALSSRGGLLACAGAGGAVRVWDVRRGGAPLAVLRPPQPQQQQQRAGGGGGGGGGRDAPAACCWGGGGLWLAGGARVTWLPAGGPL